MMWFFAVLIVLAMGGVGLVAAGRGRPMAGAYDDRPDALVPQDGPLMGGDLRRVRFSLALRGYRMAEVDALLERVAAQLEAYDRDRLFGPASDRVGPVVPTATATADPGPDPDTGLDPGTGTPPTEAVDPGRPADAQVSSGPASADRDPAPDDAWRPPTP